ncbi:MAG: AbrB/MazE/SpoVT family DNA-binding domain-containing protein [Chloroflexi bacterium]|nr:AbrB/MazE/SpoVT family DNA-binding domain-containing protein [Chloroflexota bacterium]
MALKQTAKDKGLHLGKQGRLVIPAHLREELGYKEGDKLIARVEDGKLVLETPEHALARIRAYVRSHVPPGVSLADELIAERREEARKEAEEET